MERYTLLHLDLGIYRSVACPFSIGDSLALRPYSTEGDRQRDGTRTTLPSGRDRTRTNGSAPESHNRQIAGGRCPRMTEPTAAVTRETNETTIEVTLDVDGEGDATVETGIGFLDHMLDSFAQHGLFDLTVRADGGLEVDDHHTVEDVGIVLGQAFADALGEKRGIERFADRRVPMDEARASVVLDVSGRPHFDFEGSFSQARVGAFTSVMARHFLRSFAENARLTLQACVEGTNAHHEIEALFKCLARALDDATRIDERRGVPSTKGEL